MILLGDHTILSVSGCHLIGIVQGVLIDVEERDGIKCRYMPNSSILIWFACSNPKAVERLMEDHQWGSLQPFLFYFGHSVHGRVSRFRIISLHEAQTSVRKQHHPRPHRATQPMMGRTLCGVAGCIAPIRVVPVCGLYCAVEYSIERCSFDVQIDSLPTT